MLYIRTFFKELVCLIKLLLQWNITCKIIKKIQNKENDKKILIIPCDPWTIMGSRGDQAMIFSIQQHILELNPKASIDIMTANHENDEYINSYKIKPVNYWNNRIDFFFTNNSNTYEEIYILGADVTDGVYGWSTAAKLLIYYDIFTRLNKKVHYQGFSWSKTPNKWLKIIFFFLKKNLILPVRDPVSYQRIQKFTNHRPIILVADVAFCLKAKKSTRINEYLNWCKTAHKNKKIIFVINLHPMFNENQTQSEEWLDFFTKSLISLYKVQPNICYLLIPHDNRKEVSDVNIIKSLENKFRELNFEGIIKNINIVLDADEIKAIIHECDAIIAGRMHLSIAALGEGKPIFSLVYQGKFEGLWEHFKLSQETMVSPMIFLNNPQKSIQLLINFYNNINILSKQIIKKLPHVISLAQKNLE